MIGPICWDPMLMKEERERGGESANVREETSKRVRCPAESKRQANQRSGVTEEEQPSRNN